MADLEKEGYVKLPIEEYEDLLRAVVAGEDDEAVIDKLDRKVSNLEYKVKQLQEIYMEEKYNEKSAEVSCGFIRGRNRHYFLPSY